ncbi:hypothetical protein TNCT_624671 [Trichonephila clavata]|uniref:Uncharacterized protein n=1 Tax=Trichonephila clavata TaxID=2740835 RepID=A0A8X6L4Z8_TRICU|nr:hypothetical protein TNCT_624671 [Trichonephila clavata]
MIVSVHGSVFIRLSCRSYTLSKPAWLLGLKSLLRIYHDKKSDVTHHMRLLDSSYGKIFIKYSGMWKISYRKL